MPVIKPAIVYDTKEGVLDLPVDTIRTVDGFVVPNGCRRGGATVVRVLARNLRPPAKQGRRATQFCLANGTCHKSKVAVPCIEGNILCNDISFIVYFASGTARKLPV